MIYLATLLVMLQTTLFAASLAKTGSVTSTHAEYDGSNLVLQGDVLVDHGLGKMNAERATLQKQEAGKEFPFSHIHLQDNVLVHLTDHGKLLCDVADLDFLSLKGTLISDPSKKVSYSDLLKGNAPFELKGKELTFHMKRQTQEGKKNTYTIDTLTAKNDVEIHYNTDFKLLAHQAHYDKLSSETTLGGIVIATPETNEGHCHLHHLADHIVSPHVKMDLSDAKITLQHPRGTLKSALIPHPKGSTVTFHSGELIWDERENTLSLLSDIHIVDSTLGTIDADDQLHIQRTKIEDKTVIKTITATGVTRLEYLPTGHHAPQILRCYGTVTIKPLEEIALLESPKTEDAVLPKDQLHYQEERIASFADRARIDYTQLEGKLSPQTLTMEGNIRLYSLKTLEKKRCALSEILTYDIASKKTILKAHEDKQVLFWDDHQALQIAAKEVHITRDAQSGEETIKGVGNVKFSFTKEQSAKLHELFPYFKQEATSHE